VTERLLQFIWQFQYFNKTELRSTSGEEIVILTPGRPNLNQGPDFLESKIRIGRTTWIGTVELHLDASDWDRHGHQEDANYRNVILHVVYKDNSGKQGIPVLEIGDRIPNLLLERYEELMQSATFIPCGTNITDVSDLTWINWRDRMLAERMQQKSAGINEYLSANNYHWEEAFWWMLARNYGMKVNAEAFEALAKSIQLAVISKHRNRIDQLEALLFGQAGLLNHPFREEYPKTLKREHRFLKKKHGLSPIHFPVHFLRMRPGNFPTIRLAQLAALLHTHTHLFSTVKEIETYMTARVFFDVAASEYWNNHYRFDHVSKQQVKHPGSSMIDNIIINTVVPFLYAHGVHHQESASKKKALRWLESTAAENNALTRGFETLGIYCRNAYDSQALIALKTNYCDRRLCLDCAIGNAILQKK
jgi:hypothetical protein